MIQYVRQFIICVKISLALYIADLSPWILLGVDIPRALFQALFFILMARAAGGDSQARFALIGNAIMVAVHIALVFMAGVIENEKWAGTLLYWIASPSKWLPTMLGRSVADFGRSLFDTIVIFAVFIPLLFPDISIFNLLRAIPIILLTLASASTIGWLIGSVALPTRWGTMVSNVVAYSMMILCGINFPVSALPPAIQMISHFIPVTNGLVATRAIIDGASYTSVIVLTSRELIIGFIFGAVAWLAFGYRLNLLRHGGNLELV
jgi:ABC-2 type transport system permease protein